MNSNNTNAATTKRKLSVTKLTADPITYGAFIGAESVYIGSVDQDRKEVRRIGQQAAERPYWKCLACGCEYGIIYEACPNCGSNHSTYK